MTSWTNHGTCCAALRADSFNIWCGLHHVSVELSPSLPFSRGQRSRPLQGSKTAFTLHQTCQTLGANREKSKCENDLSPYHYRTWRISAMSVNIFYMWVWDILECFENTVDGFTVFGGLFWNSKVRIDFTPHIWAIETLCCTLERTVLKVGSLIDYHLNKEGKQIKKETEMDGQGSGRYSVRDRCSSCFGCGTDGILSMSTCFCFRATIDPTTSLPHRVSISAHPRMSHQCIRVSMCVFLWISMVCKAHPIPMGESKSFSSSVLVWLSVWDDAHSDWS